MKNRAKKKKNVLWNHCQHSDKILGVQHKILFLHNVSQAPRQKTPTSGQKQKKHLKTSMITQLRIASPNLPRLVCLFMRCTHKGAWFYTVQTALLVCNDLLKGFHLRILSLQVLQVALYAVVSRSSGFQIVVYLSHLLLENEKNTLISAASGGKSISNLQQMCLFNKCLSFW